MDQINAPKKNNDAQKANQRAKQVGFKDLNELSKYSHVSRQTLNNWFNSKRDRFETILKGAMINKMEKTTHGKSEENGKNSG